MNKRYPPFVSHMDGNQVPSMMGVVGTMGTSDTGGTSLTLPVAVNPDTGAMYVQDLSGASGTTNIQGSITVIAGTQQTLGTVGTVIGMGTVTNLGSVTNIGMLNGGTVVQASGTTTLVSTITTVSNLTNGSVNILTGTVTNVGSNVGMGTLSNVGSVNTVTTVSNLTNGTVRISVGTITTGTVQNLVSGTINALASGTITAGTVAVSTGTVVLNTGTITTIAAGTQNTLGTVGVVNNIVTGTLASVRIDNRPTGSSVISTHTLGTGGGTLFGTILAPSGAGTSVYVAGLSIVGRTGTVDCGISNNVAGSTGAGVLARGFFQPGGGIVRDFNPAINLGTNGTIAYFLITAGTVDLTVNYWVAP